MNEIIDGYIHSLGDLRGKVRRSSEDCQRKLETALDAARAEPPFMLCVIERLKDTLQSLNKL